MRITGMMVYYYYVCKRKLWYFCHGMQLEELNEDVALGKLLDENAYNREDKHISIDGVINIDFIRDKQTLHEVKKSRSMEKASEWQLKYYLYYLKERGVENLKGEIDYPLIKKTLKTELTKEDEEEIKKVLKEIEKISNSEFIPSFEQKKICKKCAYYDLCGV